jgi:crotonobetainyl-CoA:carnitine CoA-transferase CaiB-like acyl-CoA transferase
MLGEHTESVLAEICGVTPEDVKRMKKEGIV